MAYAVSLFIPAYNMNSTIITVVLITLAFGPFHPSYGFESQGILAPTEFISTLDSTYVPSLIELAPGNSRVIADQTYTVYPTYIPPYS